ncbi:pyridoxal phosphate-dependent aminotransferase [Acetobacteroides hydrogenigenes]|uniref:Aminotransferase n=1 Tax=Acetobacteroides hydrogenigenes TaxID=979970 RepID=A0A4R2EZM9_9BACT|nr:aminotransferase class I/II-fold pyridoxal phosphate-dependent enzyme [Acetobacteroides hydrogenigenes]TCN70179.1 aspartate/methionine/tyrosine aminotransferase [Acetobacteroides hydrogenigenes]
MHVKPSSRIGKVSEYYFSKKLKEIDQMRANGTKVINLGIGNPDLQPSTAMVEGVCETSRKSGVHGYQSYIGSPILRQAFADFYHRYYGVTLNPANEILPLTGSKEGIMHISMAFLDEGDEVLVPNPGYPTYTSATKLAGGIPVEYNLTEENGFHPNFEEIEQRDLSKVKIMWVNYPHMPTGAKATRELFEQLVAFGRKHQILICHDNPYSFILNKEPLSLMAVEGAKEVALELNSLSKSHNMAGWRVGMLAGSAEHLSAVLTFKSNMDSGMALPIQMAAAAALSADQDWFDSINAEYAKRLVLAEDIARKIGCKLPKEHSGMFLWIKIPDSVESAEAMADKILYQKGIFITPGSIFGSNGSRFLRISLCADKATLKEAADILSTYKLEE